MGNAQIEVTLISKVLPYAANIWLIYLLVLDISCQLLEDICQLEGFCPRAQLSGAQLSTLKKWTVGPRGPTVRGPTVRGPNCPGPNCPVFKGGQLGPGLGL